MERVWALICGTAIFFYFTSNNALELRTRAEDEGEGVQVCYDAKTRDLLVNENCKDPIAFAIFHEQINKTGWAYLEVVTSGSYNNELQAYAAGVVEGIATRNLMLMHWENMYVGYCDGVREFCDRLEAFLADNIRWMRKMIDRYPEDPYWHQVKLTLIQLTGLEDGYYEVITEPRISFSPMRFLLFQLTGDLMDLEPALGKSELLQKRMLGGTCSSFIKAINNNTDLLFSHVTWFGYSGMLRIQKFYSFDYRLGGKPIPGNQMSFTSYPGFLWSLDDFYLINSGLAVMETTLDNYNRTAYKMVKPQSVATWIRAMVANRLAADGAEWISYQRRYNSGTYNNQWMVIDYKKFIPGQKLQVGLFYILELMPNLAIGGDLTHLLEEQGFWSSYNRAYFREIVEASGVEAKVRKHGDSFTYDFAPRALMFKRDWERVTNMTSLQWLMRYNDFRNDPYSKCSACTPPYTADFAISARHDLNDPKGHYPLQSWGYNAYGAIDYKATNYELMHDLRFMAICGPTTQDQPPFSWSKSGFNNMARHLGHPDVFNFEPVNHKWINY